ncbi:heterodisulfide reductase-related iron-sulfur binding cluster [Geotalea toluenoxydans]
MREVIELCADCDTCRTLMEKDCVFFPELYRLSDREKEEEIPVTEAELRELVELCTLCGLCPCPRVPEDLVKAKNGYVQKEGTPISTRLMIDVPRLARLCCTFPRLSKALTKNKAMSTLLRKVTRTNPARQFPTVTEPDFFQWAKKKGLTNRLPGKRNVTYFAGCTAGYLFPEVARATVEVLERNGETVYVPPQQCCGMPHLVEGDFDGSLQRAGLNMESLLESAKTGDNLVCSCPTCGYFMKVLLKERAYFSDDYQGSIGAGENEIRVPDPSSGNNQFRIFKKSAYKDILKDDGCFSALDPMSRIGLADALCDAGEYLAHLHAEGRLDTFFNTINERMVYYAPCHQREQKIGTPYLDLLALIPGLSLESLEETDCCGMGGNFGFKTHFHEKSLAIGKPLMLKIRQHAPQAIITDCLSCRLQFNHALPYPVFHPMEILARAYRNAERGGNIS